jgi:hypothetical protein
MRDCRKRYDEDLLLFRVCDCFVAYVWKEKRILAEAHCSPVSHTEMTVKSVMTRDS